MFAAIVLICGMNAPFAVEGCALSFAPMPFPTHRDCMESLRLNGIPNITARLPPSAFIADAQCVSLSRSS